MMNEFLKNEIREIKGKSYIADIPIEEFESIKQLDLFVKSAKENGLGVSLHHETSNFHQGVVVQIFDKETCEAKELLY